MARASVARSRAVVHVLRPAGRSRSEVTRMHAELRGMLVHHLRKYAFAAGDVFGQCDTRVIAGLHDHAEQQILHVTRVPTSINIREPSVRQAFSLTVTSSSSVIWPCLQALKTT